MTTTIREPALVPVVPAVTEADVLRRAADLLEEFGWAQGYYAFSETGAYAAPTCSAAVRFCAVGAMTRAAWDLTRDEYDFDPDVALGLAGYRSFDAKGRVTSCGVPAWNDAPGRTREEVIARLREAAEAAA